MVISRFAPSPTGELHIGGIRTALYAWLFARQQKGKFILRIENTDTARSTDESCKHIIEGMHWLGLNYDEGPIYQMDRLARYIEVANDLTEQGHAYKCYCSKERLEKLRKEQMAKGEKPKYDGYCRFHSKVDKYPYDKPYVIRFANPLSGEVHFNDRIRGELKVCNEELDDVVLLRSDGIPTYNFSVVIDDYDMGVTMVIRGDDHINNTYRQINIYRVLEAKPPQYAHVSSVLGDDGKKLSKRHGATSVLHFRDDGYLPEALINALVRLGWSHGDQEIFSVNDMISLFKIDEVHKSPAVFDTKKLQWYNQHYLKTLNNTKIIEYLVPFLDKLGVNYQDALNKPDLSKVVDMLKTRVKTLVEMADKAKCFYLDKVEYNHEATAKFFTDTTSEMFLVLIDRLRGLTDSNWNSDNIHEIIHSLMAELNLKMPQVAQPIRIALTGDINSPPINETIALMPKHEVLDRILAAVDYLDKN